MLAQPAMAWPPPGAMLELGLNRPLALRLLLLAALCFATYAATLNIPLFEDDYPTLSLAQQYGAPGELADLFHNPVYRTRATTYWVMLAVYRLFGLAPWGYRLASLAFHILGTWLLYALARRWPPMRPAALWAAMFFAVEEGHQEAVVWFAGFTEPAMLVFGLCAMLCWLRAGESARGWLWNAAGVAAFALALLSKETAVILLPLFLLAAPRADWRRALRAADSLRALGLVVAASILAQHGQSFRFTDGSFSPARSVLDHLAARHGPPAVDLGLAGADRRLPGRASESCGAPPDWRWRGAPSACCRTVS